MADLIDRLSATGAGVDERISVHYFLGKLVLRATDDVTAAEAVAGFNPPLDATALAQATALDNVLAAKSTTTEKLVYLAKIQALFFTLENRIDTTFWSGENLDKARIAAICEITL